MRLKKYLFPVAVFFMVMAFFSCTKPAEYFPLNEGDEWSHLYTVDIVGGPNDGLHISMPTESFVFGKELVNGRQTIKMGGNPPNDDYFCWRMDLQGLKLCKLYRSITNNYVLFKPPLLIFPSMFNVGDTYTRPNSYSAYSADDHTLVNTFTGNTTVTFESIEDVDVPAGTFENCAKISVVSNHDRSSGGTSEESNTSWYAKNVGMVKETIVQKGTYIDAEDIEATVTLELISATVDGKTY